jgi:hypothetical protein
MPFQECNRLFPLTKWKKCISVDFSIGDRHVYGIVRDPGTFEVIGVSSLLWMPNSNRIFLTVQMYHDAAQGRSEFFELDTFYLVNDNGDARMQGSFRGQYTLDSEASEQIPILPSGTIFGTAVVRRPE